MKLMPVAYPVKFADGIGAALDIRTREGSRSAPLFRASAGIAESDILGEGEVGSAKRGSWIASARKSYIGYLIRNRESDVQDVSFYDADLKFTYDLTPKHSVSFHSLGGQTSTRLNSSNSNPDAFATGSSAFTLARVGWRWSATPHISLDSHAAYLSEPHDAHNSFGQLLDSYADGEWLGGTRAIWEWKNNDLLEGGATLRRLRDNGYSVFFNGTGPQFFSSADGTGLRGSVYLQQASTVMKNRLHLMAGVRWDNLQRIGVHPFSEQISAAVRVLAATELQLGVGRYAQFPDFQQVALPLCEASGNLLERSHHFTVAIEQRLGESTRFRVQAFDRQNAHLFGVTTGFSQEALGGPPCGALVPPAGLSPTYERDYSRGVQVVLQRRSANRVSGWLGYTLASARAKFAEKISSRAPLGVSFPTLEDQRHSLNAFGSYRLTSSISLTGKLLYGSGYPVSSAILVQVGNTYQPVALNTVRLPAYARFDVRCDKTWALNRGKVTLYGEVLNLTNHDNRFYTYTTGINPNTGQTTIQTQQELPITPTAGLVYEF
jgi:hypothetical protein